MASLCIADADIIIIIMIMIIIIIIIIINYLPLCTGYSLSTVWTNSVICSTCYSLPST